MKAILERAFGIAVASILLMSLAPLAPAHAGGCTLIACSGFENDDRSTKDVIAVRDWNWPADSTKVIPSQVASTNRMNVHPGGYTSGMQDWDGFCVGAYTKATVTWNAGSVTTVYGGSTGTCREVHNYQRPSIYVRAA